MKKSSWSIAILLLAATVFVGCSSITPAPVLPTGGTNAPVATTAQLLSGAQAQEANAKADIALAASAGNVAYIGVQTIQAVAPNLITPKISADISAAVTAYEAACNVANTVVANYYNSLFSSITNGTPAPAALNLPQLITDISGSISNLTAIYRNVTAITGAPSPANPFK